MRNEITREFAFREEVLPLLAICVLLNLSGPYLNAHVLGIPLIFLDMSGTMVAAMLLGPWWAAAAGVLSNAFNGLAFTEYFPFALTNIAGALAWGYWFRISRERYALLSPSGGGQPLQVWLILYVKMLVVALVVAVPVSALIKVILYPPLGLPLHYNKPLYLYAMGQLSRFGIHEHVDLLALLCGDLYRELIDKGLTVALALALVAVIGSVPRIFVLPGSGGVSRTDRLKTDAVSILFFVLTHFLFLLIARFTVAEIRFAGSAQGVFWLRAPEIIALLYSPIILGVAAFIFLSHDSNSRIGAKIEQARGLRVGLYRRFRKKTASGAYPLGAGWVRRLSDLKSVYGLLTLILAWPYRNQFTYFGPFVSAMIYMVGVVVVCGLFFHENRSFKRRFNQGATWLGIIHDWQDLRTGVMHTRAVLRVVANLFHGDLVFPREEPKHKGDLLYAISYNAADRGLLAELRRTSGQTRLVFFVPATARTLSLAEIRQVREILSVSRARMGVLLCNSPAFADEEGLDCFRSFQDVELALLTGLDLERAVERHVKGENTALCLPEGSLSMTQKLFPEDTQGASWSQGKAPPDELAGRALAGVRHVIGHLPPHSLVADFGAGRGRHTLYALSQGHRVLAVDRKHITFEDLALNLRSDSVPAESVRLRECDYLEVKPADLRGLALLVITGVLQHASDREDLCVRLGFLRDAVSNPGSQIYIEMLFDMKFDGRRPEGRVEISVQAFEQLLAELFPDEDWRIERVAGPAHSMLDFSGGSRSFFTQAQFVEQTACEYVLTHRLKVSATAA